MTSVICTRAGVGLDVKLVYVCFACDFTVLGLGYLVKGSPPLSNQFGNFMKGQARLSLPQYLSLVSHEQHLSYFLATTCQLSERVAKGEPGNEAGWRNSDIRAVLKYPQPINLQTVTALLLNKT
ncbi:hypothetical protein E2C01_005327 [Portunus trituberculatus]|uniref:Uncharacterized protein n=1 Tax=Portunus trituberculatus TaxID=210409 RepID=A0A5B7CSB3_PORTR|nr:hypothetical protein [Portunus trituberculatus]